MARQVFRCPYKKNDCFAYVRQPDIKGMCRALREKATRNGNCPFYKMETSELNHTKIEADIDAYRDSHMGWGKDKT